MLTSEDFDLIHRLKEAQAERLQDPKLRSRSKSNSLKRKIDETATTASFIMETGALDPEARSHKSTKVERITRILEGRNENRFEPSTHAGGLTNSEKRRKKNYVMVRKGKRSVRSKTNTSNSDIRYKAMHTVIISDSVLYVMW